MGVGEPLPVDEVALIRFLLTSLRPPTNMTNTARPRTTARVTMAPMTPATALDTPPDPELDEAVGEAVVAGGALAAHTPVLLPHALHQASWPLMANLFIPSANACHERAISFWPKSGNGVGSLLSEVVPL